MIFFIKKTRFPSISEIPDEKTTVTIGSVCSLSLNYFNIIIFNALFLRISTEKAVKFTPRVSQLGKELKKAPVKKMKKYLSLRGRRVKFQNTEQMFRKVSKESNANKERKT